MLLKIRLLAIGVLSAPSDEALDSALDNELEFFMSPEEDSKIRCGPDMDYEHHYTNEYWHLVPELEEACDLDADRVWQQIIWTIEGDFEIPDGMSPNEAVSQMGWELSIENNDNDVGLDEIYWNIVDVEKVAMGFIPPMQEAIMKETYTCPRCAERYGDRNEDDNVWFVKNAGYISLGCCPECETSEGDVIITKIWKDYCDSTGIGVKE